ncbi:MAG: shikimate dehydrogenase [Deltaproteobacteria bacterium]|nr:shikimate dehydrogenase [Deltaproteobacteria bacterium]
MLLGVIGWPIAHSRSPAMHDAAIRALGLDASYLPMAVPPEALPDAILGLRALGFRGVNVTLPHKRACLDLLDEVDDAARAIGAVNTLVFEQGRSRGSNTDAAGMVAALRDAGIALKDARVVVLGAGGAARAAVYAAATSGATGVHVAARREAQAHVLVDSLRDQLPGDLLSAGDLTIDLRARFEHADLLIQATSATLGESQAAQAFAATLPMDALPRDASVFDMVYEPRVTSVLARAEARGLRCVGGLGMLLHQGALAFEAFTGQTADIEAMRAALASH